MTRVGSYGVAIILLSALAAAASSASAQTVGKFWVLEKAHGISSVTGNSASLTLDDKQMSGSTGCNTFMATIADRPGKRVAISNVTLTRKLCAPEANNNERAIVLAFNKTEFIEQGPGTLTFLSDKREPLLVWKTGEKAAAPNGSARAAMVPPQAGAKTQPGSKSAARAKSARKVHGARATKASRQRVVHWRANPSRIAHVSRRCHCLCSWWN